MRKLVLFGVLWLSFGQYSFAQTTASPTIEPSVMTGETPDEQLFFCTTRIETVSDDGKKRGIGTGFVISRVVGNTTYLFVATARHVLEGFDKATISFVPEKDGKPELGKRCGGNLHGLRDVVVFHPDKTVDVAIFPLLPVLQHLEKKGERPFFRSLSEEIVPSREREKELSAIQAVLFMGYPQGLRDEKNLLPVARRGFTATPYVVDFNGLPVFLIDAAVFPGSSGSPVVVFDQGSYYSKSGAIVGRDRILLLGLVSQWYFQTEEGIVQFKSIPSRTTTVPTYQTTQALGLGAVVKAKAIFETVDECLKRHASPTPSESKTEKKKEK
jgi:Trypsin-like peptidase domain